MNGAPIQYREIQSNESDKFISYFPKFTLLSGGVATGFHHVEAPPPLDIRKLYRIILTKRENPSGGPAKSSLVVREVRPEAASLIEGDVYVLDKGAKVLQLNTTESAGQEKFKAAEFARSIVDARIAQGGGQTCELKVFGTATPRPTLVICFLTSSGTDEGSGAGMFLMEFGEGTHLIRQKTQSTTQEPKLFRLSDASGKISFTSTTPVARSSLSPKDVFILDDPRHRAIWVWVGTEASKDERRLGVVYAQRYLHNRRQERLQQLKEGEEEYEGGMLGEAIIKLNEGRESEAFSKALGA